VVAYIADGTNSDSVVYGYAFRDHWMWYNGYVMDDGKYVSFIIWKDYNCITWSTINSNSLTSNLANSFDATTRDTIFNGLSAYNMSPTANYFDIWSTAYNFIPYLLSSNSIFQGDKAYTVVASQALNARYFASVCAKSYYYYSELNIGYNNGQMWGQLMLLQMR
jgi:hypothetical protein